MWLVGCRVASRFSKVIHQSFDKSYRLYNKLLKTKPVLTTAITTGFLYAASDGLAQTIELTNTGIHCIRQPEGCNGGCLKTGDERKPAGLDWKRVAVFFCFGTLISGPAMHYWYHALDKVPRVIISLKKLVNNSIVPKIANLHGVTVSVGHWEVKIAKLIADQTVFGAPLLLVFFMGIGIMMELPTFIYDQYNTATAKNSTSGHRETDPRLKPVTNVVSSSVESKETIKVSAYDKLIMKAWKQTKEVYLGTYLLECCVWPPVQLINFTYMPLRFQFLFVSTAQLLWNVVLSLIANSNLHMDDSAQDSYNCSNKNS